MIHTHWVSRIYPLGIMGTTDNNRLFEIVIPAIALSGRY
jgi:hypothetical protein